MKIHQLLEEQSQEQLDEINWSNVGQGLKKAAVATGKGIAGGAKAVGRGAVAAGQAVNKYGPGVIQGAGNLATNAVQQVGNVAGAAAGGLGAVGGGLIGGFKRGYDQERYVGPTARNNARRYQQAPAQNQAPAQQAQQAPAQQARQKASAQSIGQQIKAKQKQISKLSKELSGLQKQLTPKAPAAAPVTPPAATPAPAATNPAATPDKEVATSTGQTLQVKNGGNPGAAAFNNMAGQLANNAAPEPTEQDKTVAAIKARRAQGLAAGKINTGKPIVEFYSNFLGQAV